MSDLGKYIDKRKQRDKKFAVNYDSGYLDFKLGIILKEIREEKGITQEQLARKLKTQKSAISRLENHAEDIRISTLSKLVSVLGKELHISIQ